MKKSGFLRRVAILLLFAWCYARFLLSDGQFIQDPATREFLRWFLYAAIAWAILTMLAQHLNAD